MNPSKKSSLKRLVDVVTPDIIFLQEMMGGSEAVKSLLESILGGWSFEVVDASVRSGSLATGWHSNRCRCNSVWGFDLGLGLEVFSGDLGLLLTLVNIYGPY